MKKFFEILAKIESWIVVALFIVICLVAFANVLGRYVFNASLAYTGELTVNLAAVMTMIGAALGVRLKGHLGFSLLHDGLKGRSHDALTVFLGVATVVFFAVLGYYGYELLHNQLVRNRLTPSLRIPQWLFSLSFPVGAILCILHTIEVTIADLRHEAIEMDDAEGAVPLA